MENKIQVREIIGNNRASSFIRQLAEQGYTLGVYGNPIDEDGIFPATPEQAIQAWDEDPGLVYCTR